VRYGDSTENAHSQFTAKMWPAKRRRRVPAYNRWKFRGPASGSVDGLLLALSDGEVIGQLGLIPVMVRAGSETRKAQWACDLMVDSSARRKGIGSLLLKAAMARDCLTLGSNPSPAADVTMTKLGFRPIAGPRIMVLPLRLNHVLSWKIPAALSATIPAISKLGQPIVSLRYRSLARSNRLADVSECHWQEVASLIASRQARLTVPHVVHDSEFLSWRCKGLEDFASEMSAIRTDSGAYAIVGQSSPYFYVYDWWAPDQDECLALFQASFTMAKKAGSLTIQVLAQDQGEEQWLRHMGFLGMRHPFKIISYPPDFLSNSQSFHYSIYDSDGNL
jgi:GNAT superfamily N-acetyltransferase